MNKNRIHVPAVNSPLLRLYTGSASPESCAAGVRLAEYWPQKWSRLRGAGPGTRGGCAILSRCAAGTWPWEAACARGCHVHGGGGLASRRALPCPHILPFAASPPDANQVHKHDGRQARDCRRVYPPPKLSPKILRQRCPAAGRHTGGNIGVAPRGSRVLHFQGFAIAQGGAWRPRRACLPMQMSPALLSM